MRVLGAVRLSRDTEATTSPARQREVIQRWAEANGHQVVGWAEDLGVSASVDPWERPELGPWLRGERVPFDVVAAWRLDRLSRRVLHFSKLLAWSQETGRTLVSVTEGFDLGTPMGRMFAQIIATLAEGELEAIRERTKGSYDHLTKVGRHRGGFVPYGYRPVPHSSGRGYVLDVDQDAAEVVREIAGRVIGGESINAIVTDLNRRGVPTSLDVQRIRAGKEPKGFRWRVGNLSNLLRSETLRGYLVTADGSPIVDDAGRRVRRAEPILTAEEWDRLQREISDRATNRKPRPRVNASMLRQVAFCGVCEEPRPMYIYPGRGRNYYRCASKAIGGTGCANGSTAADWLEEYVGEEFLQHVGHFEVIRRVFVPGESHAEERAETEAALGRLVERLEKIPTGGPAERAVLARMAEHEEHLARLRDMPEVPDRWVDEPTGETFADVWARDPDGRGDLLRMAGVRVYVNRTPGRRKVPAVVRFHLGEFADPEARRRAEIAAEEALG
ncbi:recombinase family protein [Micromonospora aurantiaca (nom. illeg.)]|uniref:recombinase family protein n=1 Tax=Micromonospora aurantiaca (nom. illeg.) TaxID=47850 RepID=UPI003F4A7FD9